MSTWRKRGDGTRWRGVILLAFKDELKIELSYVMYLYVNKRTYMI
jgi:hypothetical protein